MNKRILIFSIKIILILSILIINGCTKIPKKYWESPKKIVKYNVFLETGDIIIKKKSISFLQYFGHCGIVINNNYIADIPKLGGKVQLISLNEWIVDNREIIVLKPKETSIDFKNEILNQIKENEQKKYKLFISKNSNKGFYCSQFIWYIYWKSYLQLYNIDVDIDSNKGFYVLPYDFFNSEYFKFISFNNLE